jgi:AcrR family transcriptional regulator
LWQKLLMNKISNEAPGVRERKRLETLDRIGAVGLELFVTKGYEATTIDDIAAGAGISRRTFFYYFRSKDDILVALQCEPFTKALGHAFDTLPASSTPFQALRDRLPELVGSFETEKTMIIGEIMQSTEALKVRKLAIYIDMENALLQALVKVWPEPDDLPGLRLLAMLSMGLLRLSMGEWQKGRGECRLAEYVRQNFLLLERQV